MKSCCFTGHRSNKLPWGSNAADLRCAALKSRLRFALEDLIAGGGYDKFISGMATGADTICAELVCSLKNLYPHISLECAVPNYAFGESFKGEDFKKFSELLERADAVTYVSERKTYSKGDLMLRNIYMVDSSELVLAVYMEGQRGGTKNTLDYARRKNKEIIIIEP